MKCTKNQFWLEHPQNLFCSNALLPLGGMSWAQRLNALTRLALLVFLILLLLFPVQISFLFLLLATLFLFLYYKQMKTTEDFRTEHFTVNKPKRTHPPPSTPTNPQHHSGVASCFKERPAAQRSSLSINPQTGTVCFDNPTSKRFCDDARPLDGPDGAFNNPNWMSVNQKLVGGPNPNTLIAPVIAPPCADLSYWRANNLVNHSAINDESQIDVYKSGYQVSTCCAPTLECASTRDCGESCPVSVPAENPLEYEVFIKETYKPVEKRTEIESKSLESPYIKEDVEDIYIEPNGPGEVNTACGYNPEQLFVADLPTNLPVGNCAKDPVMKDFNRNLYTQTIQPEVYTRSEINEPINANIGISFDQQFPPTTCATDEMTGVVNYTEHDPRIIEPVIIEPNPAVETAVTEANVFDPRFSGYGTSYRAYTDDKLGQPRFYYDDINAIRMPNYVVRSNIDHQPFADQYGPIPEGNSEGNKFNPIIKALANDAFLTGTIQYRTELQERLMRKRNSEMWQLRKAPIRTGGQRMLGPPRCG